MKYITEFKQFVKDKLHEKLRETEHVINENTTNPEQAIKPLITSFEEEFEKLMKEDDEYFNKLFSKPAKLNKSQNYDYKEEFEKIMKDYDNIY